MAVHLKRPYGEQMQTLLYQHGSSLNEHLQEKYLNQFWLQKVLTSTEISKTLFFPYELKEGGKASVYKKVNVMPLFQSWQLPHIKESNSVFLVNIPVAHQVLGSDSDRIVTLVNKLKEESFGLHSIDSKEQAEEKLAVVIGVNQFASIDSYINLDFADEVKSLSKIEGIAIRIFGFFWIPMWNQNLHLPFLPAMGKAIKAKPILEKKIYSKEKAFPSNN